MSDTNRSLENAMLDTVKGWVIMGLALALLGLGIYHVTTVSYLDHKVSSLEEDVVEKDATIEALNAKLSSLLGINKVLTDSVERQNAAIERLGEVRNRCA